MRNVEFGVIVLGSGAGVVELEVGAAEAGQSPDIEGLSTTGVCSVSMSSSRASASHSAAALGSPASRLAAAIAGISGTISVASSGRATQTSLQREQRTGRPASPRVARSMA